MSAAVVQVFITKVAAPVEVAQALPRLYTGAVHTAWVGYAFIAVQPLPSVLTLAFTWLLARSMFSAAALSTNSCVAVRSRPAFQAGLVSIVVARIMPKELVSGPAELVAAEAVVVLVAADPDLVLELSDRAVVSQLLPVWTWVDHPRMRGFLYQLPIRTTGFIVEVPGLHYQRVGPRPGKVEGQNYPGFVIPDRTPERKRIPSEDRRRSHSEAAGPRSGNPGLVFLQTNFEKRVALAPCALSIRGAPCAIATHAVGQLSVRVVHRQDLQLELSRSVRHLHKKAEQDEGSNRGAASQNHASGLLFATRLY